MEISLESVQFVIKVWNRIYLAKKPIISIKYIEYIIL
jgi:hypothetical protein